MNQYQPIYRKSKTSMPSTHRYHHSNTITIQTKNSDLENLNKNPIDSTTFRIPSTESLENKLAILRRSTVNRTECNKEEQNDNSKLSQLERDREYLILKNIELENEINKLDSMFNNTITSLNKGMENFKGSLLFSSHDHELLSTVANRIIEFKSDGKYIDKMMNYDEYLETNK